jgi:formylglycine-generating enzyme required for sulfatase activity
MVMQNEQDPPRARVKPAQGQKPSLFMGAIGLGASLLLSLAIFTAVGGFRHRSGPIPRKTHPSASTSPAERATDAAASVPDTKAPPGPAPEGMVWIPGGEFWMGDEDERDAQPWHRVRVSGFWMDRTEVTNEQFARFVRETDYITVAERKPDAKDYPGAPPEKLVPGSIVFKPPSGPVPLSNHYVWWDYMPGADWRHPEGPGSSIADRGQHPVVHVCWDDAVAYCKWAGKRLPTEAEWEFAARGGLERNRYVWGNDLSPGGKWMVNNWQGHFPDVNTATDGFARTAPVGSFPPNDYGLFDMAGNVWEWCADWYQPVYPAHDRTPDPQGPESSYDPQEPGIAKRVQRGGSFLCSDQYCTRYLPGARGKGAPDSATPHLGFRCVTSPKPKG